MRTRGSRARRRALITGVNGQDGSYLAEFLLAHDYEVFGVDRRPQPTNLAAACPLAGMYVRDLIVPERLGEIVREVQPDEVYHLAAHHFSSQTDENRTGLLEPFLRVNLLAAVSALDAIASELPQCRFFYAASAHVFGTPNHAPQHEETPLNPETPYAISKAAAVHVCRYFRRERGVYAAVGILYNHESPRRKPTFITAQIVRAAARAALGKGERLVVRDLGAMVDWGWAKDYVRAIWLTLQQNVADDYVIATGQAHSVREFAEAAFAVVGQRAEDYVVQGEAVGSSTPAPSVGDSGKLRRVTGWAPTIGFPEWVGEMVKEELRRQGGIGIGSPRK